MTSIRAKLIAVIAFIGITPFFASAAMVSVTADNVGSVFTLNPASPEAAAGFLVGETVRLDFTFDDATADGFDAFSGTAVYTDAGATISLTGNTSGATLAYAGPLTLELDDDTELEIYTNGAMDATAGTTPILKDDIDLGGGVSFFTNVDDLPTVFADLNGSSLPVDGGSIAGTNFWDGLASALGMQIAPPGSATFTVIPEPSPILTGCFIGLGLVATRMVKRRKTKKK